VRGRINRQFLLQHAITTYGIDAQTDMVIEEMSELTKALLKHRRKETQQHIKDIREEMADVQIMLDQMRIIYGDTSENELYKLERLAERLGLNERD
jgi:DNA-binding protein H-NS